MFSRPCELLARLELLYIGSCEVAALPVIMSITGPRETCDYREFNCSTPIKKTQKHPYPVPAAPCALSACILTHTDRLADLCSFYSWSLVGACDPMLWLIRVFRYGIFGIGHYVKNLMKRVHPD